MADSFYADDSDEMKFVDWKPTFIVGTHPDEGITDSDIALRDEAEHRPTHQRTPIPTLVELFRQACIEDHEYREGRRTRPLPLP